MTTQEMTDTIGQMMKAYLDARDKWIELNGNDNGFDAWFTKKCVGYEKTLKNPVR